MAAVVPVDLSKEVPTMKNGVMEFPAISVPIKDTFGSDSDWSQRQKIANGDAPEDVVEEVAAADIALLIRPRHLRSITRSLCHLRGEFRHSVVVVHESRRIRRRPWGVEQKGEGEIKDEQNGEGMVADAAR